jgi:hypothetical protein
MLIQIANIVGGLVLSSDFISKRIGTAGTDSFLKRMLLYEAEIGVGVLIAGILGLIERLGIFYFNIHLGSSFPQAIPAILTGLVLGAPLIRTLPGIQSIAASLAPYKTALGITSILVGLGSLLFGCISPIGCPGGMIYFSI